MTNNPNSNDGHPVQFHQTTLRLPSWVVVLRHLLRMIYPLALLGAGVFLFATFGPCGWLWLVLGLLIVLAFCGPRHPDGL